MKRWKCYHAAALGTIGLIGALALVAPPPGRTQGATATNFIDSPNGTGVSRTRTLYSSFDMTNPFFAPLGSNGRRCATCHPLDQGMAITPDYVQQVFNASDGLDPLFRTNDGSNSPNADVSTVDARRQAYSMLLSKALIRIGIPLPATAEFALDACDDPYGYASATELSCFRRPLPATNLFFLSAVMWDGRESYSRGIYSALASQARDAVLTHAQGAAPPTSAQVTQIINFETSLYTSQISDNDAGKLNGPNVYGGPNLLINTLFYPGINDPFGYDPFGYFNPNVFSLFDAWGSLSATDPVSLARASVARGQVIFNTRRFNITNVAGLNDVVGKTTIRGSCSTCHDTPSVGSHSLARLMNTGIADGSLRTPDMPLYTLRNKTTNATVQTTDPGLALTSGKWKDIGKFKVPSLRAIETQSPYMHNGFSGEILDVVNFYNTRFSIGLSDQDKADLKAFLKSL